MPRFAANLSMLFNELPFLQRFSKAAAAGFKGVEYLFPYEFSKDVLASYLNKNELEQVLFNMPPGDWDAGERGLACIPGREAEFNDGLEAALEYANALGCHRLHMMAGIVPENTQPQNAQETYIRNLSAAASACRAHNITVLIEPINLRDMPGYFLHHQAQAVNLIQLVGEANIALQMDIYHCQMSQGDLSRHLHDNFEHIGHFQIAGVPGRHEPDNGEIHYPYLFDAIDALGYTGWIGCEYRPATQASDGLAWAAKYGIG